MNPMKEALQRRRGKGLDLTIAVGSPSPKEEQEENPDVLPTSKEEGDGEMGAKLSQLKELLMDPALKQQAMKMIMEEGSEEEDQEESEGMGSVDDEMMSSMSDYDKKDLMQRKPKSLGEYARKAALERK